MSLFKKLSLLICAMAIAFAIVPITPNLHTAFADDEVKCKVSGVTNFYFTENDRTAPPRLFDAYKLVNITYVSGTVNTPLYGVEKVDANVDAAILKAFKAAGVEPTSTSGTIALAKLMPDDWH